MAGTVVLGFADGPIAQAQFSNDIQGLCVDDLADRVHNVIIKLTVRPSR